MRSRPAIGQVTAPHAISVTSVAQVREARPGAVGIDGGERFGVAGEGAHPGERRQARSGGAVGQGRR